MKKDPGKQARVAQQARKTALKTIIRETFVMLLLVVDQNLFESWLKSTKSFPEMLVKIGEEIFKDSEDFEEGSWERKLCEISVDVAEKYLTSKEWKRAKLATPREICIWFAGYLKDNLCKNDLAWDGKVFDAKLIESMVAEIGDKITANNKESC